MTTFPNNQKLKKIKFISISNRQSTKLSDLGIDLLLLGQVPIRWLLKLRGLDFQLNGFDQLHIYLSHSENKDQSHPEVTQPPIDGGFYSEVDIRLPSIPSERASLLRLLDEVIYRALCTAVSEGTDMFAVLQKAKTDIAYFGESDEAQLISVVLERYAIQVLAITGGSHGLGGKSFLLVNDLKTGSRFKHFIGDYRSFFILRPLFNKIKIAKSNLVVFPKKAWFGDRKVSVSSKYEIPISLLTASDDALVEFSDSIKSILNPAEWG